MTVSAYGLRSSLKHVIQAFPKMVPRSHESVDVNVRQSGSPGNRNLDKLWFMLPRKFDNGLFRFVVWD
jgi:hypothetical protein